MSVEQQSHWSNFESGFNTVDNTRLFYRFWQPRKTNNDASKKALIFLHRGHEHSGRIQPLVEQFGFENDWCFAWDARGHGFSPGERGDAPSFQILIQDFNAFITHIHHAYQIDLENMIIVANSVGAVIAATWLHDYAPRVRGVIMAAAAFDINLYVPLAKPALRLATCFKPDLFVTSYIRSSMLTHSEEQAKNYDNDPLIAKSISARVLLGLADTAKRIVSEAHAIDVPILMLVADTDYVVKQAPQKKFFENLSSPLKRYVLIKNCFHAIFYERDVKQAIEASKNFINDCYQIEPLKAEYYQKADLQSSSAAQFQQLKDGRLGNFVSHLNYDLQRNLLSRLGRLSDGMSIGLTHGFDSGISLDYVYKNKANGRYLIGKMIDRGYLDAIGWRGIRLRKIQLQNALSELIEQHPEGKPLRILDVAAGGGRYVLETIKRFQTKNIQITLRDYDENNLSKAKELAKQLQLKNEIEYQYRDAFSLASYPVTEDGYEIVIISGLYELFSENSQIIESLKGIKQQLKINGHIIYTGQPWHPQLLLIAKTLTNHKGQPWLMRPRPQAELDGLIESIGCKKKDTKIGLEGIFTVSVAQRLQSIEEPVLIDYI